jgi:Fe2+ transport system protein FeoA
MSEEPDILEIVKEDILKVVGRKNKKIPLKSIELETAVSSSIVSKAIKELKEEGLITDINLNIELFERIVSMGICPGEKIRIIGQIPNGIIIEVRNKKFALDKEIARKMKVLEYEKV